MLSALLAAFVFADSGGAESFVAMFSHAPAETWLALTSDKDFGLALSQLEAWEKLRLRPIG